jgi:lysophospholipase L1-like esterase
LFRKAFLAVAMAAVLCAVWTSSSVQAAGSTSACVRPWIISLQLGYNSDWTYPIPWVQQVYIEYNLQSPNGFISIYDSASSRTADTLSEDFPIDGRLYVSLGEPSWQSGQVHTVHALVTTRCGSTRASLRFTFQREQFDEPYGPGTIVGLGDSYSSGEGNPPFLTSSPCDVSPVAWQSMLFPNRGSTSPYIEGNLACSGARIADLFQPFKGQPAQFGVLQQLHPTIATVMIGGNDLGFGKLLAECFALGCLSDSQFAAEKNAIQQLEPRLRNAYEKLMTAVNRLIVVGYPRIFPVNHSSAIHCGWLTPGEQARFNQLAGLLDAAERQAATAAGAQFVSTLDALTGHELCTPDSYMVPIASLRHPVPKVYYGHPTAEGQAMIAAAVRAVLQQ